MFPEVGSDALLLVLARPDRAGSHALSRVADWRRAGHKTLFMISVPALIPDAHLHQMLQACSDASADEADLDSPGVFDWVIRYALLRLNERELAHGVSTAVGRQRELLRMGEMAGQVVHEIGNPLPLLKFHASKLCGARKTGEPLTDEDIRHLQGVQHFAERAEQILVRTRDHFRRGPHRAFESVSVLEIVGEALNYARLKAQRAGVALEPELNCSASVRADRVRIVQALFNLLSNAIEAAASAKSEAGEAWVRIDAFCSDGLVCVRISDSGRGVSPDLAPRLFQIFATSKAHGSGIGLNLSRAIAREHGGDLRHLESMHATTFELILPREGTRRPRVLVVDDDADWRSIVVSELKAHDFEVWQAGRIDEAMAVLAAEKDLRPDLCISDFVLGEQSARELISQAQVAGYDFPFVVMTGYYAEDVAQQLGFSAPVLFKPDADFFEQLLSAIGSVTLRNPSAA